MEEIVGDLWDYQRRAVLFLRPGCGYGGLNWPDVRPLLADLFDERFLVIAAPEVVS